MPIQYKIDIISGLKAAGYTTTKIRREKLIAESVLTQIRRNQLISWTNIAKICALLRCQPGDLLEYVHDEIDDTQPGESAGESTGKSGTK